jgi:hypothetical protein
MLMIHIVKHSSGVSVVKKADPRYYKPRRDAEIAYFDCSYNAEDIAQEVLELLAALCHEAKIVDGTNEDSD